MPRLRTTWRWPLKRIVDLVVAVVGLVLLSPLIAILAAAVRATSGGPVLIRQPRVGLDGREFGLLKFRSMHLRAGADDAWAVPRWDPRVTRVGRFLRRSALDELPQLLNVIRGDMSIVGPRPERPAFVARFEREVPGYSGRHRVRVGLTGLAQVRGLRGDTSIAERSRLDNDYIDGWSLAKDLWIMACTVPAILRDSGADDTPPYVSAPGFLPLLDVALADEEAP